MTRPADHSLTASDLYRLPDDDFHYELSRGYLVAEPPPGGRHGRIVTPIVFALQAHVRASRSGVVFTCDTGFVLSRDPDTVRAPDVAYLTRERFLAVEDEIGLIPGPPDLAVEVLSPGNRPSQIQAKVTDYLEFGTPLVWVCDPASQSVRCFSPEDETTLGIGDILDAPALLPGFTLALRDVFRPAFSRGY